VREGSPGYTAPVTIVVAAFIGAALLVLAIFLAGRGGRLPPRGSERRGLVVEAGESGSPHERVRPGACPLCSSILAPGARIKSDIFPGRGDRLMRIFGCPHCLAPENAVPRSCPVCGADLPRDGWAVARYFESPGRRHVHVLGCPACRPARGAQGLRDVASSKKE
jgi:hypothetical protein